MFVPLAFMAGEAFQFDWSEDWAIISGERTKLQVAHFKLSYSRAFILRAYPQQTHERRCHANVGGFCLRDFAASCRSMCDSLSAKGSSPLALEWAPEGGQVRT